MKFHVQFVRICLDINVLFIFLFYTNQNVPKIMKKLLLLLTIALFASSYSKASHFVGGDMCFEQIGPNTFVITQRIFREYCNGNAQAPTSVTPTIYDNVTNAQQSTITLPRVSIDTVIFGDACFTPTGLCVEIHTYRDTITLPNNPNGYYATDNSCCRNSAITNMAPNSATWQATIPDPALPGGNSNPKWGNYPADAYFCINQVKTIDLSCTDPDGDSLRYTLINPYNGGNTRPLPLLGYNAGYSQTNILGPGSLMIIDPATGIITARPGSAGIFVFSIRCDEYRNGVKIGESYIDLQYEALNCSIDQPPSFPPFPSITTLNFDANGCFDVVATDPNPADTFYIEINSNAYPFGAVATLPPANAGGPPTTYTFNYMDTNTGSPANLTAPVTQINANTFLGVGQVGARFCWSPDSCEVLAIDSFKLEILAYSKGCDFLIDTLSRDVAIEITTPTYDPFTPNVFSPNGDGKNDVYKMPEWQHDRCFDVMHVEIYNRWGLKVFETDDPLFRWNGTDKDGADLNAGTYYVLMQGFYGGKETTNQFPVTLFR